MSKITKVWKRKLRPRLLTAFTSRTVDAPEGHVSALEIVKRYQHASFVKSPSSTTNELPARTIIDPGSRLQVLRDAQSRTAQPMLIEEATQATHCHFALQASARIAGTDGAVISPDNKLVSDISGVQWEGGDILDPLTAGRLRKAQSIEHPIALASCWRSDNYYHWLIDGLTRLRLIEPYLTPETKIYAPQRKHFQRQSVALLGYSADRIITAKYATHIASPRVLASNSTTQNCSRADIDFLHQRFTHSLSSSPTSRIFLSRRKRGTRALLNESDIFARLKPLGFRRVLLEDLAFAKQVKLFHSAEIIVAPHGAGLANLAFCQGGAKVLEITTPYRIFGYHCFWQIAHHRNLAYRVLVSEPVNARNTDLSLGPGDSDILAAPQEVLSEVEQLLFSHSP